MYVLEIEDKGRGKLLKNKNNNDVGNGVKQNLLLYESMNNNTTLYLCRRRVVKR